MTRATIRIEAWRRPLSRRDPDYDGELEVDCYAVPRRGDHIHILESSIEDEPWFPGYALRVVRVEWWFFRVGKAEDHRYKGGPHLVARRIWWRYLLYRTQALIWKWKRKLRRKHD